MRPRCTAMMAPTSSGIPGRSRPTLGRHWARRAATWRPASTSPRYVAAPPARRPSSDVRLHKSWACSKPGDGALRVLALAGCRKPCRPLVRDFPPCGQRGRTRLPGRRNAGTPHPCPSGGRAREGISALTLGESAKESPPCAPWRGRCRAESPPKEGDNGNEHERDQAPEVQRQPRWAWHEVGAAGPEMAL